MTCECADVIRNKISECDTICFTVGRGVYQAPIAIVLHEVDDTLESLNNRIGNCYNQPEGRDCHNSFHFGVGQEGYVDQWVDVADTAWSFDPILSDPKCGICNWSTAIGEGTTVDPNLYTINIAVSTGLISSTGGNNNYSEAEYNALVRLVGCLAEQYNIAVNQNTIWRHCNELRDFPDGCCVDCNGFADFLEDVQECIDTTNIVAPVLCDTLCDAPITPGVPSFIFGANEDCTICARYSFDLCSMFTELPQGILSQFYMVGIDDQDACTYQSVDTTCNSSGQVTAALGFDSVLGWGMYPVRETLNTRAGLDGESLIPSTDDVVVLDAGEGDVTFTLVAPSDCDPNDFYIKRIDSSVNTVTVSGGINNIDGQASITLGTPGSFGLYGESVHVHWNSISSEWIIL